MDRIRDKVRYSVQPVAGPGSKGSLVLETPRVRMVLTYDAPAAFHFAHSFHGYAGTDANGLPLVVRGVELDGLSRAGIRRPWQTSSRTTRRAPSH